MRTRAIVNPQSGGRRTGRRWRAVAERLAADLGELDSVYTTGPLDATRLTREALHDGVEQVVAVGGDGTLNEVVNGFFENETPINPEAVLATMMLGTGGDFRKTLGIASEVDAFVERIVRGKVRAIDLGRVSFVDHEGRPATRYFDNISGFGVSGAVVRTVNESPLAKKLGGTFAFNWATLKVLLRWHDAPVRIRMDDDFDQEIGVSLVAVANGQFFGGGMRIAPRAELDDGLLDVVILHDQGLGGFVRHSAALRRGEHLELPEVAFRRARRVEATPLGEGPVLLDVDGEAPGRLPAVFEVVPGAIRLRS